MMYKSTRGYPEKYSFSDAVLTGIAPDGGLFVPVEFPEFNSQDMDRLSKMNYCQLASEIFSQFADDFTKEELETCVKNAYADGSFPEEPTPLSVLSNTLSILELWHGPTSAFKDMALQILPEFMSVAIKKSKKHNKIAILTATSGDTGKAALRTERNADLAFITRPRNLKVPLTVQVQEAVPAHLGTGIGLPGNSREIFTPYCCQFFH